MPKHTPTERMRGSLGRAQTIPGLPSGPSSTEETNQLLQAVKAGQISSDQLMQLLAMMAQARGGQGPQRGRGRRRGATPEQQPRRRGSPLMAAMGG